MRVGLITGSGGYAWPGLSDPVERSVTTGHGSVPVTLGRVAGVEVAHLSRHGAGHARLSNQVRHKANLAALLALPVDCLISLTACGSLDPTVPPGSLVAFDDLYFPSNRLPDGTACTWHTTPGAAGRGHWIFDRPFAEPLRRALIDAGTNVVAGGCYGHVDGPRFNSRAEVAALAAAGVTAISQTAGPEVVLAGEAELPMALLGYVTDYANGVRAEPEPVEALRERMAASTATFASVVDRALPTLQKMTSVGLVYRFDR